MAEARPAPAYEFRTADGRMLMRIPEAPAREGWRPSYMFHQPALELALRARLSSCPTVQTRLGWRFVSCRPGPDGVAVDVAGPDGPATVTARYLVGCDGGASAVRAAIGGGLFDYGFDEPWVVIDTRVGPGDRVPDVNLQLCDPRRPTTCVLMGPGRHRWEFMLKPGESAEAALDDSFIRPLLADWNCAGIEIERRAVYRFHGLVAERWRQGRVLLAGDAAHQMPPFAGQGLCSGLRDATNLAWKLAAVLDGADGALLDTYQAERDPHVRAYIELAIGMGQLVCTLDPEAAAQRDAAMTSGAADPPPPFVPPPFAAGCILAGAPGAGTWFPQPWAGGRGLDDVLGPQAWLIGRGRVPPAPGVACASLEDPGLEPFAPTLAAWLGRHGAEAVLVRPDRYVFGTGAAEALLAAWPLRASVPAGA